MLSSVAFYENDPSAALATCEKAIQIKADAQAYFCSAQMLWALGRRDDAMSDYAAAQKLEPDNAWITDKIALREAETGEMGKARAGWIAAIRSAEDREFKALLAMKITDSFPEDQVGNRRSWLEESRRYAEHAEQYDERADLFKRLGNALAERRDRNKAIALAKEDLKAAECECDAGSVGEARDRLARYYVKRGMMGYVRGNFGLADPDIAEAVKLSPSAPLHFLEGAVKLVKGEDAAAEAEFSAALGIDPDLPTALRGRATLNLKRGNWQPAIDDLTRSLKRDPRNPITYLYRASAYAHLENERAALDDIEHTVQYSSDSAFQAVESEAPAWGSQPLQAVIAQLKQTLESPDPSAAKRTMELLLDSSTYPDAGTGKNASGAVRSSSSARK